MKRFIIILLLCIIQTTKIFCSQPSNSLFNDLVRFRIEYSKKEYVIGDIVDVNIHFELITEKNVDNLKLAITDYSNNIFYALRQNHLKLIKSHDIEFEKKYLQWEKRLLSLTECDEDLILSNLNPFST